MTLNAAPQVALEDVEWRVDGQPKVEQGKSPVCRFVPYLDAVIIAKLLDQWVGAGNWSDTYETGTVAGKEAMWCRLSIRVGDEWVAKTDIGVASNFEAQKGSVSDAFKRAACLKWGVGRNVYDLPTLWAVCRTFTSQGKTQATADGQKTLDDLMRKLKALGFDDPKGKVREDEPADEPKSEPPANIDRETGEVTKPPADGTSPLDRVNALGLKGKQVGQFRDQLKAQGVPWPPANLDQDQQTAFDDVLAVWSKSEAA